MERVAAGQIALVTGASRGVGRGIATTLGRAGGIYATGRSTAGADLDPAIVRSPATTTDDAAVRRVFERIAAT